MRRIGLILCFLLVAASLPLTWAAEPRRENATVVRVVDGDTLKVRFGRYEDRVRLIGIDTPEKSANEKAYRDMKRTKQDLRTITTQGQSAKLHLEQILRTGQKIQLEYDVEQRDRHGRLLAYVYTESGEMINERMMRDGYASPMTIPPNVRHSKVLLKAFEEARSNGRGLWQRQ